MQPSAEDIIGAHAWRFAVKKFDASKTIPPDAWSALEDSMVQCPSSFGIQPWSFLVVKDPAVRGAIRAQAWNQPQATDASHLVVFAARVAVSETDVDRHLDRLSRVRSVPRESLEPYRSVVLRFLNRPGFDSGAWAAKQAYIALGFFMHTAALLRIDTCPMEGFDPAGVDDILGLKARGLSAAVMCAAGYRAHDDPFAGLRKVRFAPSEVVSTV